MELARKCFGVPENAATEEKILGTTGLSIRVFAIRGKIFAAGPGNGVKAGLKAITGVFEGTKPVRKHLGQIVTMLLWVIRSP